MPLLQIDLPEDARRLADEEIASGRFANLNEYLAALIREDRRRADERVHEILQARLQSGPGQEMTDAAFDDILDRLEAEIQRRGGVSRIHRRTGVDDDIYSLARYLLGHSEDAARRFVDAVQTTLKELAAMPGMGSFTVRVSTTPPWRTCDRGASAGFPTT